jgi:predicted phage tail protein
MTSLTLIKITNPFLRSEREISTVALLDDKTLLDVRHEYFPQDVDVVVSLNGKIIEPEQLSLTRPLPGDCILFVPKVQGGDGNGKTVLRMAAMIALMAVIPGATPLWLKVGIMFAGSMLINALLPPPKPSTDGLGSQSYSWSPQTVQQQGTAVPKLYGVNRVYGNIVATHLENVDNKQYLNALIALGLGPVKRLYDFKVNDQPVTAFQGVEVHERRGYVNQEVISNFTETKLEYPLSVKITKGSSYTYTTTTSSVQGLDIELSFPAGIFFEHKHKYYAYHVNVEVEIRKVGDSAWTVLTKQLVDVATLYTAQAARWSLGEWRVSSIGQSYWYQNQAGDTNPYSHYESEWEAGYTWHLLLPGEQYSKVESVWVDYITIPGATSSFTRTVSARDLAEGYYEIRITDILSDRGTDYSGDMYLTAVRTIIPDDFSYPRTVLAGLRALATDQLSGSLRFSCMCEGQWVRVWSGGAWIYEASANPAWCCYDAFTLPVIDAVSSGSLLPGYEYYDATTALSFKIVRYDGIDPSRLDLVAFSAWADWCDELVPDGKGGQEKRITFNGVFDSGMNMWEAALQICQVGRAVPVFNGAHITVAVDRPQTAVQLFSVGNIIEGSFKETFLPKQDRAGELSLDFINSESNYERDKFTVHDPDAAAPNPQTIQLFGVTKPSEAWRAGTYRLNSNKYLTRVVEFEADVDAIACTLGDVINVQHDVPQWGFGGRLISADANSVTLDRDVIIENGKTYGIMVRLTDDTIVTKTVTNAAGTYSVLTVSVPWSTVPAQYDPYAFGETAKIVKPFRVTDISRSSEQRRVITSIEHNASIYNCDIDEPALPTPNYSALDALPPVTGLSLDELVVRGQDGSLEDVIDVTFQKPAGNFFVYAEVWYNAGADWVYSGAAVAFHRIRGIEPGVAYLVAVLTVNVLGDRMKIQNAPQASLTALGKLDPPSDVTGFAAVQNGQFVNFAWQHIEDGDLWGYELRQGSAWEGARVIASGVSADQYAWQAELNGTYRFLIKAIDTSGLYSTTDASIDISLKEIDENINVILSQDEITKGGGPDGTKTNFVFVDGTPKYLTMPHMLLDTDISSWTDTTPEITGYEGDITLSAEYVTLSIDTLKVGATWTRILDTFDAFDRGATDQSYPDRTDMTYPNDTDTHITMPVTKSIYVQYSSNGSTWSAWQEYHGTVQEEFRYVKIKYTVTVSSTTGVFRLLNLLMKFDVPDVELTIPGFSVTAGTGNDITFSTYSTQFYTTPVVTATVIGGTVNKVPVVSNKSTSGFHIDLRDKTDASVAGTVDIRVSGY